MSSPSLVSLGIMGFSGGELLIVLAIILLLFGGSKLPSLAKGLGQSIKEFKKAAKDDEPVAPAKADEKKPDAGGAHGAN
jgi:sec-independent protein translocase protein TatA